MQVSESVIADGCCILVILNLLSLAFMRVLSPQAHMINVLWALARLCCATYTWSIDSIWIMQISWKGCLNSCELLYIVMVEIELYFLPPTFFLFFFTAINSWIILGCVWKAARSQSRGITHISTPLPEHFRHSLQLMNRLN